MKALALLLPLTMLSMVACGDSTHEAKMITTPQETPTAETAAQSSSAPQATAPETEQKAAPAKAAQSAQAPKPFTPQMSLEKPQAPAANVSAFYRVFKDGAKIAPEGKPLLLVFGQSADPYTQKFQKDVTEDKELAARIKETMTPVYVNAAAAKVHKFMHEGELMDVDTRTLVSIYGVNATPTMIFMDEQGKSIFVVPGYMPPKQFKVTLDFIKEGAYKGKDRKNGEVYEALKAYYLSHGVTIKGAK
jgi:thioredoxin-related protein